MNQSRVREGRVSLPFMFQVRFYCYTWDNLTGNFELVNYFFDRNDVLFFRYDYSSGTTH
jgi:hypothetical protein